ncbi:hypothetical protein FQR65_LT16056 [Abscondita terminalis]|nr:hypothetical protein FQR65_LT16056 [Abscondita terminalis]
MLYRSIQTAAAVLILCVGAYWLWNLKDICQKQATLTLDNGTEVGLNALKTGDLTFEGQVVASKNAEGQLTYDQPNSVASKISYHVLHTPRGGQYQIDLSDGTRVWLNAESSVRFPTSFTGDERVVEITGEAFFDVQKQKGKPFIVKTAESENHSTWYHGLM